MEKLNFRTQREKKDFLKGLVSNKNRVPKDYKVIEDYFLGDFIVHQKFGHGFVQALVDKEKMQVYFDLGEKTLLHSKHA